MISATPKLGRILVVGVRNSGPWFQRTRHNVGSYALQHIASDLRL